MVLRKFHRQFFVQPGENLSLKDHDPDWSSSKDLIDRYGEERLQKVAKRLLRKNLENLSAAQELLWASDTFGILIVLQAMDAAGKDGLIKHVMTGLNPQGFQVHGFKQPSALEINHNFLWRYMKALPERGCIGIFNRSYYEDVLVVKVHPEILESQKVPPVLRQTDFWKSRYSDIRHFEKHLVRNGILVLKFFLHISKKEQKDRFMARLDNPDKHWKFSSNDLKERAYWKDYMKAYEEALSATSSEWAPWYVIPANHKWAARTLVADILTDTIRSLGLKFPKLTPAKEAELLAARAHLAAE